MTTKEIVVEPIQKVKKITRTTKVPMDTSNTDVFIAPAVTTPEVKPEPKQIEQESGRTNLIGAFLGILVTIIVSVAVAIPITEMTDYGYVCENNNWTGIHATDDNRYWLFGDKITVLCVDDRTQNSTITNEIKAVRWSESLFNSDLSGLT
jgi:hypothetical protein